MKVLIVLGLFAGICAVITAMILMVEYLYTGN